MGCDCCCGGHLRAGIGVNGSMGSDEIQVVNRFVKYSLEVCNSVSVN